LSPTNTHIRRIRELLALNLAHPNDKLALQLLLLQIYSGRKQFAATDQKEPYAQEKKDWEEE
jgi:nitrate reductase gamma subunit